MAKNTINGKAFEYACLIALQEKLQEEGKDVSTTNSPAFTTAQRSFEGMSDQDKARYVSGAQAAVKLLLPLEPYIENGDGTIVLSIAADAIAQGPEGDVRDVLLIRVTNDWELGISCKHNHEALKHPRITTGMDFGRDWVNTPCSQEFLTALDEVISPLVELKNAGAKWRDVENKHDTYYVPILQLFLQEITRLCNEGDNIPEKLLSYFFGSHDFYKVIMKEASETTLIEGFNMNGTLSQACRGVRPITRVSKLSMPTRLIEARLKENSKTTLILTFDHGWSVAMRLHNKDSDVKPTALAWDVTLVGLPPETYRSVRAWRE